MYHCTPSELEKQDAFIVESHIAMFNLESKERKLQGKRHEQKLKQK